jgi:hypothetical protein
MGWVFCPFLSLIALVMGIMDLRAIQEGRMDSSNQGRYWAGMIIAGIQVVPLFLVMALALLQILSEGR